MKPKSNEEPQAQRKARPVKTRQTLGRPLWPYFVPVLIIAVVTMAGIALLGQHFIRSAQSDISRSTMEQAAQSLARGVATAVASARNVIRVLAADPRVEQVLDAPENERKALADTLLATTSGVLQLRILPRGWDRPDPNGSAPMGYAGVDMVRRTAAGELLPGEVHQLKTSVPYLALAEPVVRDGTTRGVLFAAVPLQTLTAVVNEVDKLQGDVWLTQLAGGQRVALDALAHGAEPTGTVPVADSILAIAYRSVPGAESFGFLELLGFAGVGALILALVAAMQIRGLAAALRADMVTALNLGEAIKDGTGIANAAPRLRATSDTLLLLAQYAQEARHLAAARSAGMNQSTSTAAATSGTSSDWKMVDDAVSVEEIDPGSIHGAGGSPLRGGQALMPEHVFRAYDVRGIAGQDLSEENVPLFGQVLGTLIQEEGWKKVLIARDARNSSPALATALRTGLTVSGCDVVDLGAVPTPVLYYGMKALEISAAVMVTGSHNPPEYNGFKVQIGDDVLSGGALSAVRDKMQEGDLARGSGEYEEIDISGRYIAHITGDVALNRPLKIVVDAGNGIAGPIALRLFEALDCEVIPLFCEPDGNFPNHHPDPGNPDNLQALGLQVQAQQADLGVALDGDGDRLGIVDGSGGIVSPDRILMLLAADVLIRHPGADVIYDVKGSRHLAGYVLSNGGRPIMWKPGHARMRAKLHETGALVAGEFSGHFYIKERWYGFDDGLYAAARVMEILSAESLSAQEIFDQLPGSPATPEYSLPLDEGLQQTLMGSITAKADFPDAKIVDLDGLRVEFADGWGLVRASNTMPSLVFRFEADDIGALERIKESFRALLKSVDPALVAPF